MFSFLKDGYWPSLGRDDQSYWLLHVNKHQLGVLASGELTGYTSVPLRWACSDSGHSSPHRTDPPNRQRHTGNLEHKHARINTATVLRGTRPAPIRILTLAAEVVLLLQVVEAVFTGRAGSAAGVGLTVALTAFLSGERRTC